MYGVIRLNIDRHLEVLDLKADNQLIGYRLNLCSNKRIIESKDYIIMPLDKLKEDIMKYILTYNTKA